MPPQPAPNAPAGGPPDPPRLSVASVARRLGVAPATLRTWDRRYGIGPSGHVPGRHRRYSADDVARLELMQHALVRGASPAEASASPGRFAPAVVVLWSQMPGGADPGLLRGLPR
ncbi:MAG TPA: MerR family transcriptional regulator, partial [Pseudonocardia sp.]|nr:MerR family transcriptional regulator [Pseudonocardia sp.]